MLEAAEIESQLRERLGHDQVVVKPHGHHFLIQIQDEAGPDTVARLTMLAPGPPPSRATRAAGNHFPMKGTATK
jgi:hypothetical protein